MTEQSLYGARIADTRATLKTRNAELATYRRYAKRIGEMLEGEIYLACRVTLYKWCSDLHLSGYELDGELVVQTIEPAGFDSALTELGLGLKERNFNSADTVVDTVEVVDSKRSGEGILLPSRWARSWFRSEVLGILPDGSATPPARWAETPTVHTPPKYFIMPPEKLDEVVVEPERKAKVLTR